MKSKSHRLLLACSLITMLAGAAADAAEADRNFLRSVGTLRMNDSQGRAEVVAVLTTNTHPNVSVTWRTGDATDSVFKRMTHAGWFVFAEQSTRIWVFDGDALSLLERRDRSISDFSSPEAFKSCPPAVRDALPESFRKRYFK